MKRTQPAILFYDIETSYLISRHWQLGKQVLRHGQLVDGFNYQRIICICYAWNDGKPAKSLVWDRYHNSDKIIAQFDQLVQKADIIIGKNNNRFDDKHVNFHRMLNELPAMPEWAQRTDDVERQFRKHFNIPSQSLDYISKLFGIGGKIKVDMDLWVAIVEHNDRKALTQMVDYCKKDVEDTRYIYYKALPYITPKLNRSRKTEHGYTCKYCGSDKIRKNGTYKAGATTFQNYYCNDHGGYAGKTIMSKQELSKDDRVGLR